MNSKQHCLLVVVGLMLLIVTQPTAFGADTADLAKASQNPVADMINLPFQNNTNFDVGGTSSAQNVLNIQPVYPFKLNKDWNLISRTILPVISQPGVLTGDGRKNGLGDINATAFFSPVDSGKWIWGAGPVVSLPTATQGSLGTRKWSAGPALVVLTIRGPWVMGGLINNVWDFAGQSSRPHVNQMTLQPFVNYNFSGGWYLSSSPIITANWSAPSSETWTIPLGLGGGRVFRIGKQPVNMQMHYYNNIEKPTLGAEWTLRFQFQFLFPK